MGTMPHQPRHVGFVRAATAWLVDLAIYLSLAISILVIFRTLKLP